MQPFLQQLCSLVVQKFLDEVCSVPTSRSGSGPNCLQVVGFGFGSTYLVAATHLQRRTSPVTVLKDSRNSSCVKEWPAQIMG